jgi:DNA repair exonuclease SbcCD ATPase subunit
MVPAAMVVSPVRKGKRSGTPVMHVEKLAEKCLDEGCPILTVENLLFQLKAANAASPDTDYQLFIQAMEENLDVAKTDRAEIEKLVEAVSTGDAAGAEKRAASCLEEGCTIMTVEDLLVELKAVKNPSAEITGTINALEERLTSAKSQQGEMGKLVQAVFQGDAVPAVMYLGGENQGSRMEFAEKCLEEGCPILTVEDLLLQIKAERDPEYPMRPSLVKVVRELEARLQDLKAGQSKLEKLVESVSVSATASAPNQDNARSKPMTGYEKLAEACLEEGCPVLMTEELLFELKELKGAGPEMAETISELEKVLNDTKARQSEVERLVEDVARGKTVLDVPEVSTRRTVPVMNHIAGESHPYETLAETCLVEGCPILTVEELLLQLRAEKDQDVEMVKTINEMESYLEERKAGRSQVEKLVEQVSASATADASYGELARECLQEGCPIDTVAYLLLELKALENPVSQITDLIHQLEEAMNETHSKQKQVERLVEVVAQGSPVPAVMATSPRGRAEQTGKVGGISERQRHSFRAKSGPCQKQTYDRLRKAC